MLRELRGGRAAGAGELSIRESRLHTGRGGDFMAELDFWILDTFSGGRTTARYYEEKRRMRLLIDGQAKDSSGLSFVRQQAAATTTTARTRHKTHSKSNSTIFHTIL